MIESRTPDSDSGTASQTVTPPGLPPTWFVEVDGARKGPFAKSQVEVMISSREIGRDNLCWTSGDADWKPLSATSFAELFATQPPPLSASAVPMGILWVLAFAPLIGSLMEGALVQVFDLAAGSLWWITICLNIGLSMRDGKTLREAGYDTSKMGAFWIVPVYLYKRAKVLKQNQAPLIVWCICWLGMILLVAA